MFFFQSFNFRIYVSNSILLISTSSILPHHSPYHKQVLSEMRSSFENKKITKEDAQKDDPRSTFLFPLNAYTSSSDLLESLVPKVQVTSARNSKLTCMLGKYDILMHARTRTVYVPHTAVWSRSSSSFPSTLP